MHRRTALETGVLLLSADGRVEQADTVAAALLGAEPAALAGADLQALGLRAQGETGLHVLPTTHGHVVCRPHPLPDGRTVALLQLAARGAERALRALAECGRVLVRAASEEALLWEVCRIVVDAIGYRLAWIGYLQDDGDVVPMAQMGFDAGFLDEHRVSAREDSPRGRGVVGTSIRSLQPAVIRDTLHHPDYSPWRHLARDYGFQSLIGLPLVIDGRAIGCMALYAREIDAFDPQEIELLSEVASDLAYGISTRRLAAEHQRMVEALAELNAELEARVRDRTRDLEQTREALEQDIERRRQVETELRTANDNVAAAMERLEEAQNQLVQSEKLASVGQLAAGLAHEINNPIGYVHANLGSLRAYVAELVGWLEQAHPEAFDQPKLAYLRNDLNDLLRETNEGIERVRKIVQDLREFSHAGRSGEWQRVDLHQCLETTLTIAHNLIKHKAEVRREYGELPEVQALPSQLNQVFMNLLVNAAQAIPEFGTITVRSGRDGGTAWVEVEDTGPGVPEAERHRIFDAFYTTKPVGEGTGLGLPISQSIVARHGGRLLLREGSAGGACFRVELPIEHREEA